MKILNIILSASALASAKMIHIKAGPELVFHDANLQADKGDVLMFHFLAKNHSVARGDFDNPCQLAKQDGFFSGYWPASDNDESDAQFVVTVNDTSPIWFYCSQGDHCKSGMVGVVNAPADHTLDQYKNASAQFDGKAGEASYIFGGVTSTANASTSMSSSMNMTTATMTATSSPTAIVSSGVDNLHVAVGAVLAAMALCVYGLI